MVCGVGTEVIAGEGLILTAGGFDSHIHFTCPQLAEEAIASGLTTMVGGGTGGSWHPYYFKFYFDIAPSGKTS